ncbi:MAG: CDP-glucose 4,6-dehydratase [Ferruginibacter sp.]
MLNIYKHKKIFITGNTGFKGSWLAAFFHELDIHTEGYALEPVTTPDHFSLLNIDYKTTIGNILDAGKLDAAVEAAQPDIIFHLAAQALVRPSYTDPVNTYQTNVTGTLNVLEAARKCRSVKAVVLITTDKVYENKEHHKPYTETDELGGYDMYSSSKACCEILIRSYRNSFFNPDDYKKKHEVLIASARAGNVIGGGDWSTDRLVPDIAAATAAGKKVQIRNPASVRPWQHVLDCLYGYVLLGAKLLNGEKAFAEAWNFSPYPGEVKDVKAIAAIAKQHWAEIDIEFATAPDHFHEAGLLILDNTRAIKKLGWKPVWNTTEAVERTIEWYKAFYRENRIMTGDQIADYLKNINR